MALTTSSISLAFVAGILTAFSPCILPVLPILVGRSLSTHRLGPVLLVSGLITGFAVAGAIVGITTGWLAGLMSFLRSMSLLLLLALGIITLIPNLSYRLFGALPLQGFIKETPQLGLLGEFILGSQLGLVWTPCAGAVLSSILLLSVNQQMMGAFGLLIVYGMGAALPMLLIAYGGKWFGKRLLKLRSLSSRLTQIGGGLIIATAIAILLGWDVQVQLWLAPLFPRQIL